MLHCIALLYQTSYLLTIIIIIIMEGAPVTIDWTPEAERSFSVNAYEQIKPSRRRRHRHKLKISVRDRYILLLAAGYSIDDIANASTNAKDIRDARIESREKFNNQRGLLFAQQSWDKFVCFWG